MKKIINMKHLAIFTSLLFSAGYAGSTFAAQELIVSDTIKEVVEKDAKATTPATPVAASADKAAQEAEVVLLNPNLRELIKSQKDAQELLSDPSLNIDATLGDISKYNAMIAVQEAKNKLEATANKGTEQQNQFANGDGGNQMYDAQRMPFQAQTQMGQPQNPALAQQTPQGGKDAAKAEEKPEDVVADIQATAVYTLGNTGYAEITYNGSKGVFQRGNKLPNGEVLESITPLSVVIKSGDTRRTIPVIGGSSGSSAGSSSAKSSSPSQPDYTLTAPRM